MKTVGLRELKNRLSEYVRQVRQGHGIVVTDRGQVVAELLPPRPAVAAPKGTRALAALARRGVLSVGAPNDPRLYPSLPKRLPRGRLERLLDEARGDR
jgi:prevent-host-death family protein